MAGIETPIGNDVANVTSLRDRLAELEMELRRNKDLLQNGEKRFLALVDSAPVMMWISSPDGALSYCNRAWLEFRGRTLAQEIGSGWIEGLHLDDRGLCIETYLKAFASRQPFRMQYRLQNARGDYRYVEVTGSPATDERGAFMGYIGTAVEAAAPTRSYFIPKEDAVRMVFALTERERQVLVLIAQGQSTKEAAAKLGISYKTADSHRSRILEKLGVHETASMVRYAIRAGLIEA